MPHSPKQFALPATTMNPTRSFWGGGKIIPFQKQTMPFHSATPCVEGAYSGWFWGEHFFLHPQNRPHDDLSKNIRWHFNWGNKKLTQMFTTESPLYYHTLQFDAGPISWACSTIPPLLPFTLKPTISSMKSFSSLVALAIFMAEAFGFAVETNRPATESKSIHQHVSQRACCWDL